MVNTRKFICKMCGEQYELKEDEYPDANCCQECFEELEESQGKPPDYEQHSDADPGL